MQTLYIEQTDRIIYDMTIDKIDFELQAINNKLDNIDKDIKAILSGEVPICLHHSSVIEQHEKDIKELKNEVYVNRKDLPFNSALALSQIKWLAILITSVFGTIITLVLTHIIGK